MDTVHVRASTEYDITIEKGIMSRSGEISSKLVKGKTAVIVTDDNVYPLYFEKVKQSYESAGFKTLSFVVEHGEHSKSIKEYVRLLDYLLENRLTRSDTLVALGGGVVGDLTGFAAATYQRGMGLVQIPTSLLAMVDSSVGGKTAVNLEHGKNQVGSFYQPRAVICDPSALDTLPKEEFLCGCAEVIKYAVLSSPELFDRLLEYGADGLRKNPDEVIAECVRLKRDVVAADEFDTGKRMSLNLGHTIGHAVEACSDFTVLHGQAVAVGMAVISRAAAAMGMLSEDDCGKIVGLLKAFGLPTDTCFTTGELYNAALSDKKASTDSITVVMPRKIGCCTLEKIKKEELIGIMRAGGIAD